MSPSHPVRLRKHGNFFRTDCDIHIDPRRLRRIRSGTHGKQ